MSDKFYLFEFIYRIENDMFDIENDMFDKDGECIVIEGEMFFAISYCVLTRFIHSIIGKSLYLQFEKQSILNALYHEKEMRYPGEKTTSERLAELEQKIIDLQNINH
jgi:hypothetical protein